MGAGGQVLAAIELTVRDLSRERQPVVAALTIAARSLSRELAGGGHERGPGVGDQRRAEPGGLHPLW